jgi:glycosyltransferase involved in cell wall biosynthesis
VPPAERGVITTEAVDALRAFGDGDPEPIILAYHPVARTNPFQDLLYREARAGRIAPVAVPELDDLEELLALARLGSRVVLHLHWLNRPLGRAATPAEAVRDGEAFLHRIDEVHAAGARVMWTLHNLLPHAARFEAEERRFRAAVASRMDLIHVMAADTADLVAPYFDVPRDRLLHVPHPSYLGAYPDITSRETARHQLGLMPDELVYLVLGAIQPYKGIGELLDAWDRMPHDGVPRRLVIAGAPTREAGTDALVERAVLHPDVLAYPRKIDANDMQRFLRAADVAVLPYVRSLNSGAQLLALTFGLPVIVPAGGGLAALVDGENSRTFDPEDPQSLTGALLAASDLATPVAREAAAATARRFDPSELSALFAKGVRARLSWGQGARSP